MLPNTSLVGNLTADAEVKVTAEKTKLVQFSVACSARVRENNEWVDRPSFFIVKAWVNKDSTLPTYLVKGQSVQVVGELVQERWEKEGKKESMVVIQAYQGGVNLVGSKKEGAPATSSEDPTPPPASAPADEVGEDEIPF